MTCESVMRVLRKNRDSVMAVLEAFVYDPLLNWRLVENIQGKKGNRSSKSGSGSDKEEKEGGEERGGDGDRGDIPPPEGEMILNKKAVGIINRVKEKLTGRDFNGDDVLPVEEQVQLLINQATSHENLCQCYIGW